MITHADEYVHRFHSDVSMLFRHCISSLSVNSGGLYSGMCTIVYMINIISRYFIAMILKVVSENLTLTYCTRLKIDILLQIVTIFLPFDNFVLYANSNIDRNTLVDMKILLIKMLTKFLLISDIKFPNGQENSIHDFDLILHMRGGLGIIFNLNIFIIYSKF